VVQAVDFGNITSKMVDIGCEFKVVGILRRNKFHLPKGNKHGDEKKDAGHEQQKAGRSITNALGFEFIGVDPRTNDFFDKRGHCAILLKTTVRDIRWERRKRRGVLSHAAT
jgi:hypothetical protein